MEPYKFWIITHFVAVFCVESNALNTLLVFDNNFWDLHSILDKFLNIFWTKMCLGRQPQKPVVLQTFLPCLFRDQLKLTLVPDGNFSSGLSEIFF